MHDHDDFDFEHSPGIPAPLPPGEHVIWQGSPDRWEVAKSAFHIRKLALYFALIFIIQAVSIVQSGTQPLLASLTLTIILSLVGLAIPAVLAYLTSRVTIYTVTNERILTRFGIALQMTINLPFTQISAADVRVDKNGFGDIPLVLKDTERVNYFVLWPHVRPWNVSKPQPMLRSIPNVRHVADIIATVASEFSTAQSQTSAVDTQPESGKRTDENSTGIRPGVSGASADAVLMQSEQS